MLCISHLSKVFISTTTSWLIATKLFRSYLKIFHVSLKYFSQLHIDQEGRVDPESDGYVLGYKHKGSYGSGGARVR